MDVGCAAVHFQPARQDPAGMAATIDAVFHHLPDAQQAGLDRFRFPPSAFVFHHHFPDADAFPGAVALQFPGRGDGVGEVYKTALLCFALFNDEPPTYRVISRFDEQISRLIVGAENQAVGMAGQALRKVEAHIFFWVEGNGAAATQQQYPFSTDARRDKGHVFYGDGLGVLAAQPQQHGDVGAVADSSQG